MRLRQQSLATPDLSRDVAWVVVCVPLKGIGNTITNLAIRTPGINPKERPKMELPEVPPEIGGGENVPSPSRMSVSSQSENYVPIPPISSITKTSLIHFSKNDPRDRCHIKSNLF